MENNEIHRILHGGMINAYTVLIRRPEETRRFGKTLYGKIVFERCVK
jgi:hypothetical protein